MTEQPEMTVRERDQIFGCVSMTSFLLRPARLAQRQTKSRRRV